MSATIRAATILVALIGAGVSPTFGQGTVGQATEMRGQRVRVLLEDRTLAEGLVQAWTVDSLRLTAAGGSTSRFAWGEIDEVLRHGTRRNTGRGVLIGSLLGAAVAGTHAGVTWEPCGAICFGPQSRGGTIALAALLGGVTGAALGGLVGAVIRTGTWEPVAIPVVGSGSTTLRLGMRRSG